MTRYAVVRGRFAPVTKDALDRLHEALTRLERVIVLIASSELAPASRLPWTGVQRADMLSHALGNDAARVDIRLAADHPYSAIDRRAEDERHIAGVLSMHGNAGASVEPLPDEADTPDLIADLFEGRDDTLRAAVPDATLAALAAFRDDPAYAQLAKEYRYIADYKASWAKAPWPVNMVTVDAVIICTPPGGEDHVLLIKRGGVNGYGQWAAPGGFLELDERLIDAAFRELREETGLVLSDDEAREALVDTAVLDDPDRAARGRVITHAFHFRLSRDLPEVVGADDAQEARWVPVSQLSAMHGTFFEDHVYIIGRFVPQARPL